jgi:hypothetical protein
LGYSKEAIEGKDFENSILKNREKKRKNGQNEVIKMNLLELEAQDFNFTWAWDAF